MSNNYDYYREEYERLLEKYDALREDYRILHEKLSEEIAALKQENYELKVSLIQAERKMRKR